MPRIETDTINRLAENARRSLEEISASALSRGVAPTELTTASELNAASNITPRERAEDDVVTAGVTGRPAPSTFFWSSPFETPLQTTGMSSWPVASSPSLEPVKNNQWYFGEEKNEQRRKAMVNIKHATCVSFSDNGVAEVERMSGKNVLISDPEELVRLRSFLRNGEFVPQGQGRSPTRSLADTVAAVDAADPAF